MSYTITTITTITTTTTGCWRKYIPDFFYSTNIAMSS